MTTKEKARKYAKKYYHNNEDYRRSKIEDRKEYAESHKKEEAKKSRDYYHSHPNYRKWKISYARDYRKSHANNKKK